MADPMLPPPYVPPAGSERRASLRFYFSAGVARRATATADDQSWPARVRDLSATGVALACSRPFDVGRLLRLELPVDDGAEVLTRQVCVVRVAPQRDGDWLIGASFTEKLDAAELERLLR